MTTITTQHAPVKEGEQRLWDWPLQGHDGVVKVKCLGDMMQIHFEHEIKGDKFGTVRREITRCYKLPDRVDPKTIKSNLSNNVLFISGQKH